MQAISGMIFNRLSNEPPDCEATFNQALSLHQSHLLSDLNFCAAIRGGALKSGTLSPSSERHLIGIVGSELDYAITAYTAECLTSDERESQMVLLAKGVNDIELGWHYQMSEVRFRPLQVIKGRSVIGAAFGDWETRGIQASASTRHQGYGRALSISNHLTPCESGRNSNTCPSVSKQHHVSPNIVASS